MIIYVLGIAAGLAFVIIISLYKWVFMSEKDRFYGRQTKKYDGLDVVFVELKGYEK